MLGATSLLAVGLTVATAAQSPGLPPAPPPDRPFAALLTNLGHDVAALPSKASLTALVVGGTAALAVHPVDDNISRWIHERGAASYTAVGRIAGDGWTQVGFAVGSYVVGLAARERAVSHLGSDLIRGQLLTGLITHGLKVTVDRRRPTGGAHAFPSGHTSASFLTAAVIGEHYGWQASLPAYGLAGFIGWTRVRDNVHWATDVIVGATIGTIVGRTVAAGHRAHEWTVSVSPAPGGVAISVVKTPRTRTRAATSP